MSAIFKAADAGHLVPLPDREEHEITIQRLKNELAQEAGEVLVGALSAHKVRWIDPDGKPANPQHPDATPVLPDEWLLLPFEQQTRLVALARAAWLSPKEAPVFLQMAAKVFVGVVRAEAQDTGPKTLNVNLVRLEVAPHQYPELEVERAER